MNITSGYIFLFLAIILGICANGFLKTTNGFTNIFPTIFCVTSIVLCLFCLSKAMNIIPVGFTYATYGGLTITAVTIFGIINFISQKIKYWKRSGELILYYRCKILIHINGCQV